MPFKNVKHELAMKINAPKVWREWVSRYGHAPGYEEAVKRSARKAAKTRASKKRGKR